jgi:hypothetical protein
MSPDLHQALGSGRHDFPMERDFDPRREMDARLRALGLRGEQSQFDAECMHCGQPFKSWTGHVSEDASLCGLCLHDD